MEVIKGKKAPWLLSELHISGPCHQPRIHSESICSMSAGAEAPRLLGTLRVNLQGADSALCPLRGREIGFQATEDGRSASEGWGDKGLLPKRGTAQSPYLEQRRSQVQRGGRRIGLLPTIPWQVHATSLIPTTTSF